MLSMVVALCVGPCPAAGLVSDELAVTGAVKATLKLTVADLRAFPADQLATVGVTRRVDDKEIVSNVRGVRLTAVLERAGLLTSDQNAWKHTMVLATASDGYRVVFSWPELFNSEAGIAVLVVFERDGQPLADREGRIALVAGRALRTGPRSVKWLTRIDVRVLEE
jgi:DMSO/TMAO reductase YedYZ molybdopterin-dependent catalytic subunit